MKNDDTVSRRNFVKTVIGGAALAGLAKLDPLHALAARLPGPAKMSTRPLGKTGHQVCLFSLGGQSTLETPGREDESFA
ncbi:MAG: hypothetical protein WEB62_10965, partial [Bacteroidota bacterium]